MGNLYNKKILDARFIFDERFFETKAFYLYHFNALPNLNFVGNIDGEKAFEGFVTKFASYILQVYKYRWYRQKKKAFQFDRTVFLLNNNCLVEFDTAYCEILHNGKQDEFVATLTTLLMDFKERQKRQPSEINLIVRDSGGLDLKTMEIKKNKARH